MSDRDFVVRTSVDKPKHEQRIAERNFYEAQKKSPCPNKYECHSPEEETIVKRTITPEEFDENVMRRLDAWKNSKNSKISKMKRELLEEYMTTNKHQPEINKKSQQMRARTPIIDRVQTILYNQNNNLTKKKMEQDKNKDIDDLIQCTFTPKINRKDFWGNDRPDTGYTTAMPKTPTGSKTPTGTKTPTRGRNADSLLKWGEDRDKKIAGKRIQTLGKDEQTFKPQVNEKSKQIQIDNHKRVDVYERLTELEKKKLQKKQATAGVPQPTFKPMINIKSRQMAEKKKERDREKNMVHNLYKMSSVNTNMNDRIKQVFDNAYEKTYGAPPDEYGQPAPVEGFSKGYSHTGQRNGNDGVYNEPPGIGVDYLQRDHSPYERVADAMGHRTGMPRYNMEYQHLESPIGSPRCGFVDLETGQYVHVNNKPVKVLVSQTPPPMKIYRNEVERTPRSTLRRGGDKISDRLGDNSDSGNLDKKFGQGIQTSMVVRDVINPHHQKTKSITKDKDKMINSKATKPAWGVNIPTRTPTKKVNSKPKAQPKFMSKAHIDKKKSESSKKQKIIQENMEEINNHPGVQLKFDEGGYETFNAIRESLYNDQSELTDQVDAAKKEIELKREKDNNKNSRQNQQTSKDSGYYNSNGDINSYANIDSYYNTVNTHVSREKEEVIVEPDTSDNEVHLNKPKVDYGQMFLKQKDDYKKANVGVIYDNRGYRNEVNLLY